MKVFHAAAVMAALVLSSGAVHAGPNGPNPPPRGVGSQIGGGSNLGAAQMGGSYTSAGVIIVGFGARLNATSVGTGSWEVPFNRDLSACVWTGSIGNGGFTGSAGASHIAITGRAGNTRALFVQTFDNAGSAANLPFLLHVLCG